MEAMGMSYLIRGLLLALLVAALVLGYKSWEGSVRRDERAKVTAKLNDAWQKELREAEFRASQELLKSRKEHDAQYQRLAAHADALSGELQKRPTRAQLTQRTNPAVASTCPVCTGERLAREDGEFLAGEAAAANAQQLQLQFATEGYDTCRTTLEQVTRGAR